MLCRLNPVIHPNIYYSHIDLKVNTITYISLIGPPIVGILQLKLLKALRSARALRWGTGVEAVSVALGDHLHDHIAFEDGEIGILGMFKAKVVKGLVGA